MRYTIPAFSMAPFIAIEPNLVEDIFAKAPPKLPNGVRTADII